MPEIAIFFYLQRMQFGSLIGNAELHWWTPIKKPLLSMH
jgi:hypothetical protein